jgi:hypothetical protein
MPGVGSPGRSCTLCRAAPVLPRLPGPLTMISRDGIHGGTVAERTLPPSGTLLSAAQARVGRPLTPMSYAGVARIKHLAKR